MSSCCSIVHEFSYNKTRTPQHLHDNLVYDRKVHINRSMMLNSFDRTVSSCILQVLSVLSEMCLSPHVKLSYLFSTRYSSFVLGFHMYAFLDIHQFIIVWQTLIYLTLLQSLFSSPLHSPCFSCRFVLCVCESRSPITTIHQHSLWCVFIPHLRSN